MAPMPAGHIEKRRNKDGSVSWKVVVRVGYGRGARREARTVCRTERDQEKPPRKAQELLPSHSHGRCKETAPDAWQDPWR